MSVKFESQDMHVALIPTVTVEFTSIVDPGDEQNDSLPPPSHSSLNLTRDTVALEDDDLIGPSPMEQDEFAYPTNITSGSLDCDLEEYSSEQQSYATGPQCDIKTKTKTVKENEAAEGDQGQGIKSVRNHSRVSNASTGSDLVQVTVEDLLISEEQNRTVKETVDQVRQGLDFQKKDTAERSGLKKDFLDKNTMTRTTITATIRSTGEMTRSIFFDDDGSSSNDDSDTSSCHQGATTRATLSKGQPAPEPAQGSKYQSTQSPMKTESPKRMSQRPPAPPILTVAQKREAEADENIQKAIELHENNRLEEATHYFRLAAQSENPLGQLMYGLSLRHGWGCKPNATEAIVYLQRAAEYALGELKVLSPGSPHSPSSPFSSPLSLSSYCPSHPAESAESPQQQQQYQDQQEPQQHDQNPAQHTLRRMGSMDRNAAIVTARKELVMALYELGMSYLKGWGVPKDKSVAFTYFKIASDLGDPDSQNETALCYYQGIGIEKNAFEAAKYYRMAAAQGASQMGNSWIWKPKYDQYCAAENAAINAAASAVGVGVGKMPKRGQERSSRLTTAINTALTNHSNKALSPTSSAIHSPSIAGLASVTSATAGAAVPSINQPSTRQSFMGSTNPSSPTSPTSSMSSILKVLPPSSSSTSSLSLTSPPLSTTSTSTSLSLPLTVDGMLSPDGTEKKRFRWSLWGSQRSTLSPSSATSPH
ncbi:hypothetical protein BG011_007707 [Mortierella polycephala]|uniref:HCP-like protein n=1 Tax=Mortierella polycephala TaxID=41804 RepID=A0A9P6PST0_9FUNG|nr:hypothetical protein BG011_007707 [Mortierella polycephala]